MTRIYYEADIIHTSSDDGDKFYQTGEETKVFDSAKDITDWLKKMYDCSNVWLKNCEVKRSIMYYGENSIPCGYVFEFEDADYSHAPVVKWIQRDWVSFSKIVAEDAFKEVAYEVPEN
jgi:hypothetical protein